MSETLVGANLRTAESVACGHPDKLADQIADAVLDAYLRGDPRSRVACEVALSGNEVWVFGEVTSDAIVNIELIARAVIYEAGYRSVEQGIDPHACEIRVSIKQQSLDISTGITKERLGAGDQGIMYGYATNEHHSLLPAPVYYAHAICRMLPHIKEDGLALRPDGKAQVTFAYSGNQRVLSAVVVSAQHDPELPLEYLRFNIMRSLEDLFVRDGVDFSNANKYINPAGRFVVGGPTADAGLTGRKIAVDTYGGLAKHGGGALSGKDGTKVDRSAAYAARHAAKNIVAAGIAAECEVSLSYAIGEPDPVAITVETYGTGVAPDAHIARLLARTLDFSPTGMIERLELRTPIFAKTAVYGHFSSDIHPWERLDAVAELQRGL